MKSAGDQADKVKLKQKKGTWIRFIKLFPKCRLPWIWLIAYIILDLGIINIGLSETDYTAQLFAGDTSASLLTKLIGVIILNLVGTNLLVFVRQVTSAKTNRNMRGVVLNKVMRLPMSYFKDSNPRDTIYRILENSIVIDSTIMVVILPLATAAYKAVSIFGRVFQYDWRLSVILLAFIPLQLLMAVLFGRINFYLSKRETSLRSGLMQRLAELVTNIPLAKAFAKEEKETKNGEELTSRLYKINIKSSWFTQLQDLSNTALSLLQAVVIVLVGVLLLNNDQITTRAWIAFFMFSSLFSGAIEEFMMYWNNVKIIQGNADKVAEIMNAPTEDLSGEPCTELTGNIELEHVRFGYDPDKPVLTDVSCQFEDRCVTALLGVSGCGKTTLVNLLTRLYEPQQGVIRVGENSIHKYALDSFRDRFVMVSQNPLLFSGSVRENVCYGNGDVTEEAYISALKQAGAYDFVMALPQRDDTMLEEYGNNLSGGQRQRLAVARALLSSAHYLILDEPVASMDAIASAELMQILKQVAEGRCVIVIAHTAAVLPLAQRVVIVENGTVTAQGETHAVMENSAFLKAFAGKEAQA